MSSQTTTNIHPNLFPRGTRVFYWTSSGDVKYAVVQSSRNLVDGSQILELKVEGSGAAETLPASAVTKVYT